MDDLVDSLVMLLCSFSDGRKWEVCNAVVLALCESLSNQALSTMRVTISCYEAGVPVGEDVLQVNKYREKRVYWVM